MAISFDDLPKSSGFGANLEKGIYKIKVATAEMRTPKPKTENGKTVTGPDYLNLVLDVTTLDGQAKGKIFDKLFDSDKQLLRYKLKCFIEATVGDMSGASFELKDLTKIVVGKEALAAITIDTSGQNTQNVIDIFADLPYKALTIEGKEEDLPFYASDAEDAVPSEHPAPASDGEY